MRKVLILVILDGWGIGRSDETNPIYKAQPRTLQFVHQNFSGGALQASGIAVGLPWEEEGDSEVGHLTIGAGKILYQHYPRISLAVDDGSFFENLALKKAFAHTRNHNSKIHLAGLLSGGNVHSSLKHLLALIKMAERENCQQIYLHLFTDGRDSPPKSALNLIEQVKNGVKENTVQFSIASLSGRYYAMNRDAHWDRTEKVYQVISGINRSIKKPEEMIQDVYNRGLDDEFVEPALLGEPTPLEDNDAVIFFNFREDSMRQITEPFLNKRFEKFPIKKIENLLVITMTQYNDKLPTLVAFPPEIVEKPLGEVLSQNNKIQLRIAETEKYAHVTYFFNGRRDKPFSNEYRVLIPSRSLVRYQEHPEMRAEAITDRTLIAINEGGFDFILVNYANADIISHTGDFEATLEAVKIIDQQIEKIAKSSLDNNHTLIITADHGNAEALVNLRTGLAETKHNLNPVPFYIVAREFRKTNQNSMITNLPPIGLLSDVAPTILELMNIPKPQTMTGQSLLDQLT